MAHRMEIELTSPRGSGEFTWRAAGARQPRGTVAAALLPEGSKVGDVLRVEAEVEIDGITILAALPSREKAPVSNLIEVVGTNRPVPGVTTLLATPPQRRRRSAAEGRPDETDGRPPRPRTTDRDRAESGRDSPPGRGSRTGGRRPPHGMPGGVARPGRGEGRHGREGGGQGPEHRRRAPGPPKDGAPVGGSAPAATASAPRPRSARFDPGCARRDAFIAGLAPEERPIAERLARGGLPALRKAIVEEQERARAAGRPVVSGDPLVAMAEQLLPGLQAAAWMDRAEAAAALMDEIGLRDLRMTVVSAVARDKEARRLEGVLREALEARVGKLRADWEQRLKTALDEHKVLQALRLSSRLPEPTARFPASLVEPLVSQASQAMTAATSPERWLALLDAAAESPLRRQIKPGGVPADETGEVLRRARLLAGRVPALARLLGMAMPPPPRPLPGQAATRQRRASGSRSARQDRRASPPEALSGPGDTVVGEEAEQA